MKRIHIDYDGEGNWDFYEVTNLSTSTETVLITNMTFNRLIKQQLEYQKYVETLVQLYKTQI